MTRLEELNILIPKLNAELPKMDPYNDGSGLTDICKKIEEIRDYQVERYKLSNPDNEIPLRLKFIQIKQL